MADLALIHGQLVTMSKQTSTATIDGIPVIKDGGMLIRDGRIARVGKAEEIDRMADCEVLDLRGQVVTPGFIDSHTHCVFGGNRATEFSLRTQGASYEEIANAGGGIQSTVKATRDLPESELLSQSQSHVNQMIRQGTTAFEFKSGYGLTLESEAKMLRVGKQLAKNRDMLVSSTFLGAHAVPPDRAKRDYLQEVLDLMLPTLYQEGLVDAVDMFVETNYFDHEDARQLAKRANELGLQITLHVDQLANGGGAKLGADLGARSADHLEHTSMRGIEALVNSKTYPVVLPISVYGLGKTQYPLGKQMIQAGLPLVIATDYNPGSSPSPSLPLAVSLCRTQMSLSLFDCLKGITVHPAKMLGWENEAGTLEIGKRADFLIHEFTDIREFGYWIAGPACRTFIGGIEQLDR